MTDYVSVAGLQIAKALHDLVRDEIAPGTGADANRVWEGFATLVRDLGPKNRALLAKREALQQTIDAWHRERAGEPHDDEAYKAFLYEIGYLLPEGEDFEISTANVDEELTTIPGPQLVVPVSNARYALNAANARWGSLFDALYGTDAISETDGAERGRSYNPIRGARVIAYAQAFLDEVVPLATGSYADAIAYGLRDGRLRITLSSGKSTALRHPDQFVGYRLEEGRLSAALLRHHGLHIELALFGRQPDEPLHPTSLSDVIIESAISTVMDCEDSVAAVDAEDKVHVYRNWLGLMKGELTSTFEKRGRNLTRALHPDRRYLSPEGSTFEIPGRSLMLIRNVGHLMTTDAVLDQDGQPIFEGMLDGLLTTFCAMHDLRGSSPLGNSRTGSIYIVKPKMHGPDEVAFAVELFARIESVLGLPATTIKIGVMDEERRTTLNLKECIRAAKERLVFINTGFLDRTGDEIHTSMEAGPVLRRSEMKAATWLRAYEDWNVEVGLACGLSGKAQIGKGMWTMPDRMAEMLAGKGEHPSAGANCAWVPSPTSATLHALHYHRADVFARQTERMAQRSATLDDLLTIPIEKAPAWTPEEIQRELDTVLQSLLGYVVRWVDQGAGVSKVLNIDDIGLMEDRATLRIASQHIANWLRHGVVTTEQVEETMRRMARKVDAQNIAERSYAPLAPSFQSIAFQAVRDLVLDGCRAPNGYTEPTLHRRRRELKRAMSPNGTEGS